MSKVSSGLRYLGSKLKILPHIKQLLEDKQIRTGLALDGCAGSARVSRLLRSLGFTVHACDILKSSHISQKLELEYPAIPEFFGIGGTAGLRAVLRMLADLPPTADFVTREYSAAGIMPRMYFTIENAGRIDAVRNQLEEWRACGAVSQDGFDFLLAILLRAADKVANTAGHYDAFHTKKYHDNACRPLTLKTPRLLHSSLPLGRGHHADLLDHIMGGQSHDVVYLDPPYVARQYDRLYHVMERIAIGWNEGAPALLGKTGKPRSTRGSGSRWSKKSSALAELERVMSVLQTQHLIMSYSSKSIIPRGEIERLFKDYGRRSRFECREIDHGEYCAGRGEGGRKVTEYLFYTSRV